MAGLWRHRDDKTVISYLQDIKRVSNNTANTTGNSSGQKFHVEWCIRSSTKGISDGSVGCFEKIQDAIEIQKLDDRVNNFDKFLFNIRHTKYWKDFLFILGPSNRQKCLVFLILRSSTA